MDWHSWHEDYDRPGSSLSHRLVMVQEQISWALNDAPAGPVRVVSVCAGQGRDLLGVLVNHPRRNDVSALLVELDERNVELANHEAPPRVTAIVADAAQMSSYDGWVPADIVLMCGVFGNISDEDVERTIIACQQLCRIGAPVIWTRHRRPPDLVPQIDEWFVKHGFERVWINDAGGLFGVGAHRFTGTPRMFTFLERPWSV